MASKKALLRGQAEAAKMVIQATLTCINAALDHVAAAQRRVDGGTPEDMHLQAACQLLVELQELTREHLSTEAR